MDKKVIYKEVKNIVMTEKIHKLGSIEPCVTTELQSPENGVRRKTKSKDGGGGGIIDLLMKKKGMKSWHDGV